MKKIKCSACDGVGSRRMTSMSRLRDILGYEYLDCTCCGGSGVREVAFDSSEDDKVTYESIRVSD